MTFSAKENNSIQVNLVQQVNDTSWSKVGSTLVHSSCNSGYATLKTYPIVKGHSYTINYSVIAGGGVQAFIGGTAASSHGGTGNFTDTVTAGANGFIQFYSATNVTLQYFAVKDITITNDAVSIVYSPLSRKWNHFKTMYPEFGASLDENTVLAFEGNIYVQQNGSLSRNNFFGTQYAPIFTFVETKNSGLIKTYNSLVLQSNQVMITTPSGIATALGQVSELAEIDFVKGFLSDGVSQANIESVEGVYSASFLRDKNVDLQNGPQLKGNYIIIALTTPRPGTPLKLFSVAVNASQSKIGAR